MLLNNGFCRSYQPGGRRLPSWCHLSIPITCCETVTRVAMSPFLDLSRWPLAQNRSGCAVSIAIASKCSASKSINQQVSRRLEFPNMIRKLQKVGRVSERSCVTLHHITQLVRPVSIFVHWPWLFVQKTEYHNLLGLFTSRSCCISGRRKT